jgi:heat shock protein HslJ
MLGRIIGSILVLGALAACQSVLQGPDNRPLTSLIGTEWGVSLPGGIDQSIRFQTGSEVSGSSGCNGFFGTFTQQGPRLTFGPIASTRRACPEPLNSAEQQFFDALARTRSLNASTRELALFGEQGEILIRMSRRG